MAGRDAAEIKPCYLQHDLWRCVLEKYKKLKVCFAHGGGSFLPTISRIEHGWDCRPTGCY